MKILFVSSGNYFSYYKGNIAPFVKKPAEALLEKGIELDYFLIKKKGIIGYISNIWLLKKHLYMGKYDIIHAHYGYCGIVSYFSSIKEKVVVSFMGSDLLGNVNMYGEYSIIGKLSILLNQFFAKKYDFNIVKSAEMKKILSKNVSVISNGVALDTFFPIDKNIAREKLNITLEKKIILFIGDSEMPVKNYKLASKAIELLNIDDIELRTVSGVSQKKLNLYYNSANLLLLTSFHEGSPNVIKEAMSTNCPIVSTPVGDVPELIKDIDGCYLCSYNEKDVADKIHKTLFFSERTLGRDKILNLKLQIEDTANSIINIYTELLTN